MADEQQGGNVARVGLSLDSTAFRSGVQRTLADIESLLSGLRKLGSAGSSIGASLLGPGGQSAPLQIARDIQRTTIPALRGMERQVQLVNSALIKQNQLQASSIAAFTAASKQRSAMIREETLANLRQLDAAEAARKAADQARLAASRTDAAISRERAARKAEREAYLQDAIAYKDRRSYHMPSGSAYPQSARINNRKEGFFGAEPGLRSFEHPSGAGKIEARYIAAALEEILSSNQPNYPAAMQPRNRGSSMSDRQIQGMIKNFDPSLILRDFPHLEEGTPVTVALPDGRMAVISGNGRVMAMRGATLSADGISAAQKALIQETRNKFFKEQADFIKSNPQLFGGDSAEMGRQMAAIGKAGKTPVLIRQIAGSYEGLGGDLGVGRMALQLNNRTGMNASEEALAVARLLGRTPNLGHGSAASLLSGNGDAIAAFKEEVASIIGKKKFEKSYLTGSGAESPELAKLLERTLFARAYGSDPDTQRLIASVFESKSGKGLFKSGMAASLRESVGAQLGVRAKIEAGSIGPELDPLHGTLGRAVSILGDVERVYGQNGMGASHGNSEMALQQIQGALGQQAFAELKPDDRSIKLAQGMLVSGEKNFHAFMHAVSQYASRVRDEMRPTMFPDPTEISGNFNQMIAAGIDAATKYQQNIVAALADIRKTKPGAKAVPARRLAQILDEAVSSTLNQIAEQQAAQLAAAAAAKPAPAPTNGSPFSKDDALLRARGEDLRTFGASPRAIGTAPNYMYENQPADIQRAQNENLMTGLFNYMRLKEQLTQASAALKSGGNMLATSMPHYYRDAFNKGATPAQLISEMAESMGKIEKYITYLQELAGSRGLLHKLDGQIKKGAEKIPPYLGDGVFDPNTLAFNVPDKLKYTKAIAGKGVNQNTADQLMAAITPMLEQYFYAPTPSGDLLAKLGIPNDAGIKQMQQALGKSGRMPGAGLLASVFRGDYVRHSGSMAAGSVSAVDLGSKAGPMGNSQASILSINALVAGSVSSILDTLVHEISHTTMRAKYGDAAGRMPEADPRFVQIQAQMHALEGSLMPQMVRLVLADQAQQPAVMSPKVRSYAQKAGGLATSGQLDQLYIEQFSKQLGPEGAIKALEFVTAIVKSSELVAQAFGQGTVSSATTAMNKVIANWAELTAAVSTRPTYALEAAGVLHGGFNKLMSAPGTQNPLMMQGGLVKVFEDALARMAGGRLLAPANALMPTLPKDMRDFISTAPTDVLSRVLGASGKNITNLKAMDDGDAAKVRAALLGLVTDFEKASAAAKNFATSAEIARSQISGGQSRAHAPPSVSNVLPPSSRAPQLPPVTRVYGTPISLGPGGGAGGFVGGGDALQPGGGSMVPPIGGGSTGGNGGGNNARRPGSGGSGGGYTIGGGAFDDFRSWWAANGEQVSQFLKFTANNGIPRYGGLGTPVQETMGANGGFNPIYSAEQLSQQRQTQRLNKINAGYQATIGSIMPQYQSAYSSYQAGQFSEDTRKSNAKTAFVEQQLNAQAAASAQSRLNMIVRDGHIQFGQLAKAVTATGNGMVFSTLNTLKFATALAFGRQITMTIIQVFDHLRGGVIEFNAQIEAASVGFTTLFKNSGMTMEEAKAKTNETIQALIKFANVTNFRFGELETAALRMKAFGFEIDTAAAKAKGQMPILEMMQNAFNPDAPIKFSGAIVNIGDAVAALGAEDDKLRRVTYALGQMNSAGRVYQNDMMQLSNAGIAGYDILSKAILKQLQSDPALKKANAVLYNKLLDPTTAVDAVRQLAKVGKIGGPQAVQAILQGLKERYGGGMEAFAKTFKGAMTTIADTSQFLIATAFKPFFEMVRDQTYQLSLTLQTPAATAQAQKIGVAIKQVTDGIKGGLPGVVKVLETFGGAFANVISGFSENLQKPGSTVLGFFDSFAHGLGIVGDILSNQVIGKLVATGVAMKVLASAMAANPLMATIIGGTALVGFLGNAADTNAFGLKDTINNFTTSVQAALANTSASLVPTLTSGMAASLQTIGAILLSAVKTVMPTIQTIIEKISLLGGTFESLAPIIGTFFGIWLGKRILIDGIAAAMLKLATATKAVGTSMSNARTAGSMASMFGTTARYSEQVQGLHTEKGKILIGPDNKVLRSPTGEVLRDADTLQLMPFGSGKGFAGGPSMTAAMIAKAQADARIATANGTPTIFDPTLFRGQENMPVSAKEAPGLMQFIKGQGPYAGAPERDQFAAKVGPEEAKRLSGEFAAVRETARGFGSALKETFTSVQGFKTGISSAASSVVNNMGQLSGASIGVGIGLTALGTMLNNDVLTSIGGFVTQIGLLMMGLNAAMGALMLLGASSGVALAISALAVGFIGLFAAADSATKALRKLAEDSPYGKQVASDEAYVKAFTEAHPELAKTIIKENPSTPADMNTPDAKAGMLSFAKMALLESKTRTQNDINKMSEQDILDSYNLYKHGSYGGEGYDYLKTDANIRTTSPAALQAMRDYDIKEAQKNYNLVYGPGSKDVSKNPELKKAQDLEIVHLASLGTAVDDIAKKIFGVVTKDTHLRVTDAIAGVSGTPAAETALKLLKASVDTSGQVAKDAADALTKASEAFQTPLNRLLARAKELLKLVFEDEKKQLETERSKALDNITVLSNGETIRLGTLKEQYATLVEQRQEMEKLKALEKDRQAAAEAAAAMFDANVDPLQRAVAAREAARTLYDNQGQNKIDNMQAAITAGEASVPYKNTVDFYDLKLKQLETNQSDRERRLDERIQDLQKKIDEGKITLAAAKAELNSAFSDAGIDVAVLRDRSGDIGKQFGQGFYDGLIKNLDATFANLGAYILAAAKKLKADKDLIAAQDLLASATEPKQKYVKSEVVKESLKPKLARYQQLLEQINLKQKLIANDPTKTQEMKALDYAGAILRQEITAMSATIKDLALRPFQAEEMLTAASTQFDSFMKSIMEALTGVSVGPVPAKAAGGPIFNNGSYMVGERGPELLKVGKNGQMTIVPNHMLPTYLKSSAGALGAGRYGIGNYAFGTGSGDSGVHNLNNMSHLQKTALRLGRNGQIAGDWKAALGMLLMRAGAPLGALAGKAGGLLERYVEWGTKEGGWADKLAGSWENIGGPGYEPSKFVQNASKLGFLQTWGLQALEDNPFSNYLSTNFLKSMGIAGATIGGTYAEGQALKSAPGFLMDLLTGGPRSMTSPNVHAHPSRSSISGTVNIHNPQLNSAADIDRLAEKVAAAQTRSLRAMGYARPR